MARPSTFSARISPLLDLNKIEIELSPVRGPVLTLRGRAVTQDPRIGHYSEVTMTLNHLPESAVTFIADMKRALAGFQQEKKPA